MRRKVMVWFHTYRQRYIVRLMAVVLATVVAFYSTAFYIFMRIFEDKAVSAWQAVYWTVNRLSTTGEQPASLAYSSAAIQALSILTQISGLAFFFAAFPLAILPALERRIQGMPVLLHPEMDDHILICGYSPLVESLIDELAAGPRSFRVIDHDLELVRALREKGVHVIYGDPTDEEVLMLAGVSRAAYVIANREDEEDNAKIVLTSAFNSQAQIFALIDDLEHAQYFKYAGAAQVISPKRFLGIHLARKATASWRDELFGANQLVPEYFVVELPIYPGSPFDGLTLRESQIPERSGATLVGIWHKGKLELEPGPQSRISAENVLVAVGHRDQLLELQKLTRTIEVPDVTVKRHFVIAGFGDVGRAVKQVLDKENIPSVIIDPRAKQGDYIRGDATDGDILKQARIEEASTLVIAGHVDRDNIFTTLVARRLNPDLHILARANMVGTTDNLYRAGADFVFSLSAVGAQMLAEMIIGDGVVTLAEGLKVLTAPVGPKLAGRTIDQARIRTKTGCTVLACAPADGGFIANPKVNLKLAAGMFIIILGQAGQLQEFKRRFA